MDVDASPCPLRPNPDMRFRGNTRGGLDGVREEMATRGLELSGRQVSFLHPTVDRRDDLGGRGSLQYVTTIRAEST